MGWRYVVAPQWQGSGSSRAMRLIDGAEAIRGDLPSSRTTVIDAPIGAGDALGTGVRRASAVLAVRDRLAETLAALDPAETPLVIGGDCGVELAAVDSALRRDPSTQVLWFDAHADLNTAESSPSGAFGGMALRAALGDTDPLLAPSHPLPAESALLVGARTLDDGEAAYLADSAVRLISADDASAASVVDALGDSTGPVYLHIDLDVLDPADIAGVGSAEPFGIRLDTLLEIIASIRAVRPLAGAGITGFAPESPAAATEDLSTILRILSAITSTH